MPWPISVTVRRAEVKVRRDHTHATSDHPANTICVLAETVGYDSPVFGLSSYRITEPSLVDQERGRG